MLFGRRSLYALFVVLLVAEPVGAQSFEAAIAQYNNGDIEAARKEFSGAVDAAEKASDPRARWHALIAYAWFLDEIGEHRAAIEQSNRALEIAAQTNDKFMIGRSLSWLGWGYTGLGLYELAVDFYKNAIELATPQANMALVHVWGLSTQELGALYYKMGRLEDGRKHLQQALEVARKLKVGPGISEGAAHLAELSLTEGRYEEAEALAREALTAGEECPHGCTPYNTLHARVVLSKVLVARAKLDSARLPSAQAHVKETLAAAEKAGLKRCAAESTLLLASTLPAHEFEERFKLTSEAFQTLAEMESEMRGSAESELGKLFLDNGDLKLAEHYLKNGFRVNKDLFRRVDNAFIVNELATVSALKGDQQNAVSRAQKAFREALATSNDPLAVETGTRLAATYAELGFSTLAMKTAEKALRIVDRLLEKSADEASRKHFRTQKLELSAIFAGAALKIHGAAEGSDPPV